MMLPKLKALVARYSRHALLYVLYGRDYVTYALLDDTYIRSHSRAIYYLHLFEKYFEKKVSSNDALKKGWGRSSSLLLMERSH